MLIINISVTSVPDNWALQITIFLTHGVIRRLAHIRI